MVSPLVAKLSSFTDFSDEERRVLDGLCRQVKSFPARTDLIEEGDRPEAVFLLLEGWACRYKLLPDGRRQIMAYLLPGDLCDVHIFILKHMDHAIGLLSDARVAAIPKKKIVELTDNFPNLARALWWSTLVDEGVLREWLVNMGQRDALARIAHLFVELYVRLKAVGLNHGEQYDLPLIQQELGDTMGLTSVHVNRVLQRLRADGLIELARNRIHLKDVDRLIELASFTPNYLHLDRRIEK
jgi:CRP-like cAMP-binding protein